MDDLTTDVAAGRIITWKLASNSRVTKILNVVPKDSNQPEFLTNKSSNPDGSFSAVLAQGITGVESYNIVYNLDNNPIQLIDDPRMKVNND